MKLLFLLNELLIIYIVTFILKYIFLPVAGVEVVTAETVVGIVVVGAERIR